MISHSIARFFQALKAAIAKAVSSIGIHPNFITVSSLFPMVIAAWALSEGRLVTAGLWIIAGGALDLIDGAVARLSGKATPFGGVLDSVVDRASDTLLYVGAVLYFDRIGEPLYVGLSAIALGGALAVSYTRARAENVIPECEVGFFERGERIVLLLLGLLVNRLPQAILLLAVLSWLTTVQRLIHAHRHISATTAQDR